MMVVSSSLCPAQIINLASDRPVRVSSTDHAATQAEFAVDGESITGWRSRYYVDYSKQAEPEITLPQWLCVDLQGKCTISKIRLFCEADANTPKYVHDRRFTVGYEIYSSYPTSFSIQVSDNGIAWRTVRKVEDYKGGWCEYDLPSVSCRQVRIFINGSSTNLPVAINEIQVLGTCEGQRPETTGWKTRRKPKTSASSSALTARSGSVLPIMSGWEMVCEAFNDTSDGAVISSPSYDSHSWYDATVPGSVVATLVEQEVFPDPVSGLNNLHIPDALCRYNWWMRRTFRLPAEFQVKGKRVLLEADKINHHADFWVNGHKVGNIDYCFVQGSFDVTDYINVDGENVVAVRLSPMELVGVPGDKSEEGTGWVNSRIITKASPTYICSSGWDWMPATRDRATGILEEVRLRTVGEVRISHPQIVTDLHLPDTSKAYVSINIPLKNTSAARQNVTVSAAFSRVSVSENVTLDPGDSTVISFGPDKYRQLVVKNPKLWWPNGYGSPNLYDLKITASSGKEESDRYECKFGIRKVTYNIPLFRPRRGADYIEKTNARYVRIYMDSTTTDRFGMMDFSVYNSQDFDTDLAAWQPAEASSARAGSPTTHLTDVRGVSKWYSEGDKDEWAMVDLGEEKTFDYVVAGWDAFGLAAKYKIQVSNDKQTWKTVRECIQKTPEQLVIYVNGVRVFCKGGNWGFEELAMRMPRERMETAIRFHADSKMNMIRTWMGNFFDDAFFELCDQYGIMVFSDLWGGMPADMYRYCEIARDNIIRFRNHPSIALWCASNETYPAIYIDDSIMKAVKEYDPQRLYVSHSADDVVVGGDGVYFWVDPVHYYEMAHGFRTEIGLPTFPVYETALNTFGQDVSWPMGDAWYYHDYCNMKSLSGYIHQINTPLGEAKSLKDYCEKAQFVNYENMRAIFESSNHNMWEDCSAQLLWMTHPAWYSTLWQTYDYDFDVNGSWAGAKKGCESIHIQASLPDWQVDAVNTTSRDIKNVSLTAAIYDITGKEYWRHSVSGVSVPASGVVKSFNVEFADNLPALTFVKLTMKDKKGNILSDNFYWHTERSEDLSVLNDHKDVTLDANVTSEEKNDSRYYHLNICNTSGIVAAMLRVSLKDAETGDRILPVYYSDNFIWLLPGEKREIILDCKVKEVKGKVPQIVLSGYNTKDKVIPAN